MCWKSQYVELTWEGSKSPSSLGAIGKAATHSMSELKNVLVPGALANNALPSPWGFHDFFASMQIEPACANLGIGGLRPPIAVSFQKLSTSLDNILVITVDAELQWLC